ncbi:MAG: DEAD/DEAH box helicase, partial [Tenericutes bacterium GWF2_57_13]
MSFDKLNIIEPILRALEAEGYEIPTPIQEQAIPPLLLGRDVLGSAQTGTGKTAAFAIPILQHLTALNLPAKGPRPIKTLILTPTRELALQIKESFDGYGRFLKIRNAVIFGGVSQGSQTDALRAGVDVLVATPGRLLDLMDQGFIHLESLTVFVLDEADRMLDMGFIHDVKKVIAKLPAKRQTMLFSATMPPEIAELSKSILINPIRIAVVPVEMTVDAIDQKVYFVAKKNKTRLLVTLLEDPAVSSALVFSRTKHGANKIVKELTLAHVNADAIHGNKSQTARQQALGDFKAKKTRILVATDIAARGLDIDHLSHVINYDLPEVPETYIHRIGRTGRAGLEGAAISFCDVDELPLLRDIVRHIKRPIPIVRNHPHAESYPDPLSVTGIAKSPKQMSADEPREPKNFSRFDMKNKSKPQPPTEKKE